MRCDQVRSSLPTYVDGVLPDRTAAELENHLRRCVACRDQCEAEHRLAELLSEVATVPLPDGFASRVLIAARRKLTAPGSPAATKPAWWRRQPVGAVPAAASAIIAVGLGLGTWMAQQTWYSPETRSDNGGIGLAVPADIESFYGVSEGTTILQEYAAVIGRSGSGE